MLIQAGYGDIVCVGFGHRIIDAVSFLCIEGESVMLPEERKVGANGKDYRDVVPKHSVYLIPEVFAVYTPVCSVG